MDCVVGARGRGAQGARGAEGEGRALGEQVGGHRSDLHPLGLLGELERVQCFTDVRGTGRHAEDHGDQTGLRETVPQHPGEWGVSVGDVGLLLRQCPDHVAKVEKTFVDANSFGSTTS